MLWENVTIRFNRSENSGSGKKEKKDHQSTAAAANIKRILENLMRYYKYYK